MDKFHQYKFQYYESFWYFKLIKMNASWSIDFKKCAIYSTAGGIAGVSIDLLLFPVDSIKTRLQATTIENNFTQKAKEVNKF